MRIFIPVALLALAACDPVGPDFTEPQITLESQFTSKQSQELVAAAEERWWEAFQDPTFTSLMERGLALNIDIKTAQERIREAEALTRTTGLAAQVSGNASASTGLIDFDRNGDTSSSGRFGAAFVIDLFGGIRREQEAALADLAAAEFNEGAVRLAFQAALASSYIEAQFFKEASAASKRSIASQQRVLELIESQVRAGDATEIQLVQTRAELSLLRADLIGFQNAYEIRVVQIATLLADPISPVKDRMSASRKQLFPKTQFSSGVPANLLRNRPDVLAAERILASRMASVGVAQAALAPSLTLIGDVRITSGTTDSYRFGPALVIPILSRPRLLANRDAAISRAKQAELDWRNAVIDAVSEVEVSLIEIRNGQRELVSLQEARGNYRELIDAFFEILSRGGTTVFELLDAEQDLRETEISVARLRRDVAAATAQLAIATGRGSKVAMPGTP